MIMETSDEADVCKLSFTEMEECFICRDVPLLDREPLRRFCDCKKLLAHHSCLIYWVKKGPRGADRLRCRVCNTQYHRKMSISCWTIVWNWQIWTMVTMVLTLMTLVPYAVYNMMKAFENPPPHPMFRTAAICFGLLSEAMLSRFLWSFIRSRYHQAEQTSFTLQPRRLEEEEEERLETPKAGVKVQDNLAELANSRLDCGIMSKQDRAEINTHHTFLWLWGRDSEEEKTKLIHSHEVV